MLQRDVLPARWTAGLATLLRKAGGEREENKNEIKIKMKMKKNICKKMNVKNRWRARRLARGTRAKSERTTTP